jgi:hypothetical protein
LAWAITIHKSQGLTFDKVIVDAGQSFAAGQVYVALSRCRTLQGMVLRSIIRPDVLFGDERIAHFSNSYHSLQELQIMLENEQSLYVKEKIRQLFVFGNLMSLMNEWKKMLIEKDIPEKETATKIFEKINHNMQNILMVSDRFYQHMEKILSEYQHDAKHIAILKKYCSEAIECLAENIYERLIIPLQEYIQQMTLSIPVKKYAQLLQMIYESCWHEINRLYNAKFLNERLFCGEKKYSSNLLHETKD